MDCNKFQDSITDYLDGALDARGRAECAAHRLICRECRALYTDVQHTVQALSMVAHRNIYEPEGLENRIISATTAGEMLSCSNFDRLIEQYFDGVLLAPTYQTFQSHFETCGKCRRLMVGIEDVISMCREIKETELEVPDSLHERIVAATSGAPDDIAHSLSGRVKLLMIVLVSGMTRFLWNPQMAVAALIFAASTLLILSRFGSVTGMAYQAGTQAEILVHEGQRAISQTGTVARVGLMRVSSGVNTILFDGSFNPRGGSSVSKADEPRMNRQPDKETETGKTTGRKGERHEGKAIHDDSPKKRRHTHNQ